MSDYVSADTVAGHPLSGSGKQIPNPAENQFWSGSDAGFRSVPAADPGILGALWHDGTDLKVSQG